MPISANFSDDSDVSAARTIERFPKFAALERHLISRVLHESNGSRT